MLHPLQALVRDFGGADPAQRMDKVPYKKLVWSMGDLVNACSPDFRLDDLIW